VRCDVIVWERYLLIRMSFVLFVSFIDTPNACSLWNVTMLITDCDDCVSVRQNLSVGSN
jgi:hypothetical protein